MTARPEPRYADADGLTLSQAMKSRNFHLSARQSTLLDVAQLACRRFASGERIYSETIERILLTLRGWTLAECDQVRRELHRMGVLQSIRRRRGCTRLRLRPAVVERLGIDARRLQLTFPEVA